MTVVLLSGPAKTYMDIQTRVGRGEGRGGGGVLIRGLLGHLTIDDAFLSELEGGGGGEWTNRTEVSMNS